MLDLSSRKGRTSHAQPPARGTVERRLACPQCGAHDVAVKDSRVSVRNIIRRRRVCNTCDMRWSTIEIDTSDLRKMRNIIVIKEVLRSFAARLVEMSDELPDVNTLGGEE